MMTTLTTSQRSFRWNAIRQALRASTSPALARHGVGAFRDCRSSEEPGPASSERPEPGRAIRTEANHLSHPDDLNTARRSVEISRAIGNSAALRPFTRCEVAPGNL